MVLARGGMVCASQPLAVAAGAEVLRGGGNAVDAAVCTAATLGVVEPFMTGIGGDCFALIWHAAERTLHGLNGSGRAPADATQSALADRGLKEMPVLGMLTVTVPGAVDAWCEALERFGTRSLGDLLQPAVEYAREGFPVSEIIARQWDLIVRAGILREAEGRRTFTVDGAAPRLGTVFRQPDLARTLARLAAGGREEFYRGELAAEIGRFSAARGGLLTRDDLAAHRSTWVEPIVTDYRGHHLYELPPNGQGLTALIALNILEHFDLAAYEPESAPAIHLRIEAVKLAFADRDRYIADPDQVAVPTAQLLSKDYAQGRAALIRTDRALKTVAAGRPSGGDTVYLTTADRWGNVVSLINSLGFGFGCGMVVDGTGIALQNRGAGFSLDPAHPNCIAPCKRPFHTIIPAMVFRDRRPLVSFGVMGGNMQPQGHVQVISNLVDYGCNIQEAIDQPRFNFLGTDRVALEGALDAAVGQSLRALGHVVEDETVALLAGGFGGAQGIMIDPATGAYWGGSDQRKDGCAIGF